MLRSTAVTSRPAINQPSFELADRPDSLVCAATIIGSTAYHSFLNVSVGFRLCRLMLCLVFSGFAAPMCGEGYASPRVLC
jgi:hypothetical protein